MRLFIRGKIAANQSLINISHDVQENIMPGDQERIEVFENKDKKKYRKRYKKRVKFREIKGVS